jgi:hypothetical protein
MLGSSRIAVQLAASQEGLNSMKSVSYIIIPFICLLRPILHAADAIFLTGALAFHL